MPEALNLKDIALDTDEIIGTIASSPEFQDNLEAGYNLNRSLARTALSMVGRENSTSDRLEDDLEDDYEPLTEEADRDKAIMAIAGTLDSFVHGLEGIRHHHEVGYLDRSTYSSLKGRAARFNHAVKALIEQDPELTFADITTVVTDLYGVLNRQRFGDDRQGFDAEAAWFKKQLESRLRGMQHEVVARQVIEAINKTDPVVDPETGARSPRVEADPNVSVEDDLKGADLYVTLEGVTFPIDIKASERTAAACRKKSRHPKSILTSGITSHKLAGAFQADEVSTRRAAPAMLKQLYEARQEFLQQNRRRGRAAIKTAA